MYYKYSESFISETTQHELYNTYKDDFKISPLDKSNFYQDLQLFTNATEILEKKFNITVSS